jgi:hypothetical protein
MKTSLLRATGSVASIASCLVLFGGVASANPGHGDNGDRGDHWRPSMSNVKTCTVKNITNIHLNNDTEQTAESGDVTVTGNDSVGNVSSGDASNTNNTTFDVNVVNGGCAPVTVTSGGGNGGGQTGGMGGETPTPVVATTTSLTPVAAASTPAGGLGAGQETTVAQVSVVPQGGVGAGTGGQGYLAGLTAVTLASGAAAGSRLFKLKKSWM